MIENNTPSSETQVMTFAVGIFGTIASLETVLSELVGQGYKKNNLILFTAPKESSDVGSISNLDKNIDQHVTLIEGHSDDSGNSWRDCITFTLPTELDDENSVTATASMFSHWLAPKHGTDLLTVLKNGHAVLFVHVADDDAIRETCSILLRHSLHQVRTHQVNSDQSMQQAV